MCCLFRRLRAAIHMSHPAPGSCTGFRGDWHAESNSCCLKQPAGGHQRCLGRILFKMYVVTTCCKLKLWHAAIHMSHPAPGSCTDFRDGLHAEQAVIIAAWVVACLQCMLLPCAAYSGSACSYTHVPPCAGKLHGLSRLACRK